MAHQVQAAGAEVEIGALPDLVSDRLAVEQVFTNLLDNALKYRDPARPLRLAVRGRAEDDVRVYEVEDTGRGIAERDRERVFELFRRAGGQGVPGEGVGLAHVRALVRRLGGRIDLDSTPGRGSVFRVSLPAALPQALEPTA
jgi:signal transduction histidine kinase